MSNYHNGDLLLASNVSDGGVIRAERVWQHRHEIDLADFRPRSYRRRVLAIGASGVMAGLVCAVLYAQPVFTLAVAVNDDRLGVPAVTATAMSHEGPAKLQNMVDLTPASSREIKTELASLPVVATPTGRPVSAVKRTVDVGGKTDKRAEMPEGVVRFDQCKPQCETQDPLIAGPALPRQDPVAFDLNTRPDEQETRLYPILDGARYVLGQTVASPLTALRVGRDALGKIAGLN